MGRNTKPEQTPVVPVNGAIYRNSSQNGLIIEATGAQYLPSTATALITSTDYPKYVALNSQTSLVNNVTVSASASKNFGTVISNSTTFNISQYIPYMGDDNPAAKYPFCGRTSKFRYIGMTATNGTNVLNSLNPPGYKQGGSNGAAAIVFNATTGEYVGTPSPYPLCSWYDTTTSLFRVLASPVTNPDTVAQLYTSTTGAEWSATSLGGTRTNNFHYNWFGGRSGFRYVGAVAVDQKAFVIGQASDGSDQSCIYCSTNGGATVNERTTALNGTAAVYFSIAQSNFCAFAMNYDGTTLFVPINTGSSWRYSTNDGLNWSNTTISGVTSSKDQNVAGAMSAGANSSTFMMLYHGSITSNRVFVTTDGGQNFTTYSWTPAATLSASYYQMPGDYDSANTRWVFAYQTTNGWYAARSTNNGATWTHSLIQGNATDTWAFNLVFLGGSWWCFGSIGVWRSTDAATWTKVLGFNATISYGQPYLELTDYVIFGKYVIKKSDNSFTAFNDIALLSNQSGYAKNFSAYLTSDRIVQMQTSATQYSLITTSATAATANNYSPYPYSNQQQGTGGTNPIDIEYWRIK